MITVPQRDREVQVARLRQAGLRVTPQRVAVLRALAGGRHLATPQAVWEAARRSTRGLGLMTVYRILERLRSAGVAEQVDLRGSAHFGLSDRHHDHAICERCGAVEPTDGCLLRPVPETRLPGSGFLVTSHRLDLLGLCRACQEATR